MPRTITSATSLDHLRKEAKRWLKALRAGQPDARARFERVWPAAPVDPVLRDVQHALALEYGHESWIALKNALAAVRVESAPPARGRTAGEYEQLASDMVAAFDAHDEAALQRLNAHYQRTFTFDDLWAEMWRRVYSFRQRAFKGDAKQSLQPAEAQIVIAQDAGFGSWEALTQAMATGAPPVPAYAIDTAESRVSPRRQLTDGEWDELIAVMKERKIAGLDASGLMTDAVLARVATLDHVTALSLGGSRQLTDDGLLHLANMHHAKSVVTASADVRQAEPCI